MDKLKEILAASKSKQRIINNKQKLAQQKQKYLKEECQRKKIELEEQKKRFREIQQFYEYKQKRKIVKTNQTQVQIPLQIKEVKSKLRQLDQPITLFGQSQLQRYRRYQKVKKFHQENPNIDMKQYDEQYHQKLKQNQEYQQLNVKFRPRLIQPKLLGDLVFRAKKLQMIKAQKNIQYTNICDQVYLWITKVLRDWEQQIQNKYQKSKAPPPIQKIFQIFQQTCSDFRGFFRVLKKRTGDKEMVTSIYHIMNCCLVRQYIEANDKYIQLSIGNAPWPMGVAMLGITVKKNTQRLSHVLNDQVTRRWMQGIKRLISVSQQLYQNQDKLKMVGYTVHHLI